MEIHQPDPEIPSSESKVRSKLGEAEIFEQQKQHTEPT